MSFLITMSQKELHRLEVIQKSHDRRLSDVHVAGVLGVSRSQMHRLLNTYEMDSMPGLISKKRRQPSNRRHSNAILKQRAEMAGWEAGEVSALHRSNF